MESTHFCKQSLFHRNVSLPERAVFSVPTSTQVLKRSALDQSRTLPRYSVTLLRVPWTNHKLHSNLNFNFSFNPKPVGRGSGKTPERGLPHAALLSLSAHSLG